MSNIEVNSQVAKQLGLLEGEFQLICEKLNRIPNFTELCMFSGMWSEHCSYKNSIQLLKHLFCASDRLLAKPGSENAGALKINDDLAVVFKVESHNHPSAIEPYQGAATGVGGIMRDVFTMGARPIASLNSLRFGFVDTEDDTAKHNIYLMKQAVKGIADYGNSLGIPNMGGEIFFHPSYSKNPLVNAMTIGIAKINELASAKAKGIGNIVMYAGAKTGRDGIHGASFASKNLSTQSAEERSAVQVGDPFMEKLLMEASLECISKGLIIAMQDMGAAGLISSSSEMSSSGNVGMVLHLDRVPSREAEMQPFEYLLSESQERMLLVVSPQNIEAVKSIYQYWQLTAIEIGEIIEEDVLRIYHNGEICAEMPPKYLTKEAPEYTREYTQPSKKGYFSTPYSNECFLNDTTRAFINCSSSDLEEVIETILGNPNIASKEVIYSQYDTDIGLARIIGPGQNGGVVRVLPTEHLGIAASLDGNGYYIQIDPYLGAQHTVAEGFRNIIATGATPIGITNCLNFANPYIPENFYFFKNAVEGMSKAAEILELPITGGNVSFYNESEDGPVLPTPTIGTVGLHHNVQAALGTLVNSGDNIFLLGCFKPELASSFYRWQLEGLSGPLPTLNLEMEKTVAKIFLEIFNKEWIHAATDLSIGGLLTGLFKMIFTSQNSVHHPLGFSFVKDLLLNYQDLDTFLWGETAHTYLMAAEPEHIMSLMSLELPPGVEIIHLGHVIEKKEFHFSKNLVVHTQELSKIWNKSLGQLFI